MRSAETHLILTLSTDHMPGPEPDIGDTVGHAFVSDMPGWAFFLWVPDDPQESSDAMETPTPPWCLAIQKRARSIGADYVLFDCDGPVIPELEVFDWDALDDDTCTHGANCEGGAHE